MDVRMLLRYVAATVARTPVRLAFILMVLCLSGAAELSSVSLSETMIRTTARQWRSEYGYADIVIKPTPASASRYLDPFRVERYADACAYVVRKLSSTAYAENQRFIVHGYTLDTLCLMMELAFPEQRDLIPFEGDKIIVSTIYAREHGVRVGDSMTLNIGGNLHRFVVAALCRPTGPFAGDGEIHTVIIPFGKMQSCLGQLGRADAIYISLKDKATKSHMILRLSELYKGYSVGETYSVEHIRLETNRSAVPFVFMSVLLCLMAVYVVYVVFQNIVMERMPQMGAFRAIGASRAAANAAVFAESAAYGALGGALSIGAGALMLHVLARRVQAAEWSGPIELSISPWHMGGALMLCVGISIVGATLALRRFKELSIVDLIRRTAWEPFRERRLAPLIASLTLLAATATLVTWRSATGFTLYVMLVVAIIVSFLVASPFLYQGFAGFLKRMAGRVQGLVRVASLTVQNQRGFGIAATICAVITATNMITGTITYSNDEVGRRYFGRFRYDIELVAGDLTRGQVNLVEQLPGVKRVCANYYAGNTEVKGQSISIYRVHGVDPQRFGAFMDYAFQSTRADPLGGLDGGKYALLTNTLRNLYGLREGDAVTMKIFRYDGSYREVAYTVIGFFDDDITKLGRYALISQQNFREDFGARAFSSLSISADRVDAALASIRNAFRDQQIQVTTVKENQDRMREESRMILSAMRWIADLSALTGALGMLFVMLLSFRSRARELAIYGAIGLTKGGVACMLFAEMLLSGIGGVVAGAGIGALISLAALPRLVYALQIAMGIYFHPSIVLKACGFGMAVCAASGAVGAIAFAKAASMGGLRHE